MPCYTPSRRNSGAKECLRHLPALSSCQRYKTDDFDEAAGKLALDLLIHLVRLWLYVHRVFPFWHTPITA
jgi:hypothetical protein